MKEKVSNDQKTDAKIKLKNALQFMYPITDEDSVKNLPSAILPIDKRGFKVSPNCYLNEQEGPNAAKNFSEETTPKSKTNAPYNFFFSPTKAQTVSNISQIAPKAQKQAERLVLPDFPNICVETLDQDNYLLNYSLDDVGNVKRFSSIFGQDILFNTKTNQWFIWNGKSWQQDVRNSIKNMAEQVVVRYKGAAQRNFEVKKNLTKEEAYLSGLLLSHAKSCCNNTALNALVKMLEHHFPILPDELNNALHLLNVKNGTIDLRTGNLKPHDRKDYITQCIDVDFNPLARSTCFHQFINEIFCYDPSLIEYVQTALGYCITGDISEQCFFIAYGDGSNGKSTLSETIGRIFKDYVRTIPISILMDNNKGGTASPEIVNALYSRIVLTGENKDGEAFNEGKIKILTGGNTLCARPLYGTSFEFVPKFKIWMDTNYLPNIKGMDYGIWRRVKVIPFKNKIDESKKDKTLPLRLMQDSEAILSWLVQGAIQYYAYGLRDNSTILEALSEYKESEDSVTPFIQNCLAKQDDSEIKASELYEAYTNYCLAQGANPSTNTQFGRFLKNLGFEKSRSSKGQIYKNIKLVTN